MLPKSIYNKSIITTRTPMRITLAGGGTDVIWYSSLRGGAWISAAINKYIYVSVSKYLDSNQIKLSDGINKPVVTRLAKMKNDIIRECLLVSGISGGISINIRSDVTSKSGLGGSGSLEIGLIHALYKYKGLTISPLRLAELAASIEIDRLQKSVGPQDQYIAALGGIRYFEIDKKGNVKNTSLCLSQKTLNNLKTNLLFFSTNIIHDTGKILTDEKEKAKHKKSSNVIKTLDEIKNIGRQAKRYLLTGDIDNFGKTFHNHWLAKKKLTPKVTSAKIDCWYDEAFKMGALGGKIMGSGGGGWFVFYVNKNHSDFITHMQKMDLKYQFVNFDWDGTILLNGGVIQRNEVTKDPIRIQKHEGDSSLHSE